MKVIYTGLGVVLGVFLASHNPEAAETIRSVTINLWDQIVGQIK